MFSPTIDTLQVLMSSTSYPLHAMDWRVPFIKHLVDALAGQPDIRLSYWGPPGEQPPAVNAICRPDESAWLKQLLELGGIAHLLRQGGMQRLTVPAKLLWLQHQAYRRPPRPDLFHINWLQNALPLCGTSQPALISVLGSDMRLLNLPGMVGCLRHVFGQRRTILAPNAEWMTDELKRHFSDVAEIQPIPFGIDDKWYELKRAWPRQEKNKWLVVLRLTKKKIGPLFEWGKALFEGNDELHLFGPMQEQMEIPGWVHYHGPSHPAELLEWFSQAAGLITLSQHDEGRPQVILEAMAAGLPVIASKLPAHCNLVQHRKTGWIVATRDDLRNGLDWLKDPICNLQTGESARTWVRDSIGTWDDCAHRYVSAYRKLLEPTQ